MPKMAQRALRIRVVLIQHSVSGFKTTTTTTTTNGDQANPLLQKGSPAKVLSKHAIKTLCNLKGGGSAKGSLEAALI